MCSLSAYRKLYPSEFYEKFLKESIRPDGRDSFGTREVHISTGSISTAYGSSMAKLGNTAVVAGVQGELAFEDLNLSSQLIINLEVGGISGTNFTGKPSESTQALSSRLRSVVDQCNLVQNLEDLYVEDEDTKVLWYLIVDLYCLDHDGNLFDTCLIALISALLNTRLPVGKIKNGRVIGTKERSIQLTISPEYPLSLSFSIFQEYVLADPTNEEEQLSNTTLSIVASVKGGNIWQIYKPGGFMIEDEKLRLCTQYAMEHIKKLSNIIEQSQ